MTKGCKGGGISLIRKLVLLPLNMPCYNKCGKAPVRGYGIVQPESWWSHLYHRHQSTTTNTTITAPSFWIMLQTSVEKAKIEGLYHDGLDGTLPGKYINKHRRSDKRRSNIKHSMSSNIHENRPQTPHTAESHNNEKRRRPGSSPVLVTPGRLNTNERARMARMQSCAAEHVLKDNTPGR